MGARSRTSEQVEAALNALEEADASDGEKAEMLMEIALGLQQKPRSPIDIEAAIDLYRKGVEICPVEHGLLIARIRARLATALMAFPSEELTPLIDARGELELALKMFGAEATREEIAEAEMNLGLALQNLAGAGKAPLKDSIAAYQRALRTFDKKRHPKEYAILQNNIATAFLSTPLTGQAAKMREALAVQAFEEGLSAVTLVDQPSEYAMLQNNLGNALQYASSGHRVENGFRALEAYAEALKVRDRRATPGEYANTIANKANCLANLPDDPSDPESGNLGNLRQACALYREAEEVFREQGEYAKAETVAEAVESLMVEIGAACGGAMLTH